MGNCFGISLLWMREDTTCMVNLQWARILVKSKGRGLPGALEVVIGSANFSFQLWWNSPPCFSLVVPSSCSSEHGMFEDRDDVVEGSHTSTGMGKFPQPLCSGDGDVLCLYTKQLTGEAATVERAAQGGDVYDGDRRGEAGAEIEEERRCFSPRFDAHGGGLHTNKKLKIAADPVDSSIAVFEFKLCPDSSSNRVKEHFANVMQLQPVSLPQDFVTPISKQTSGGNSQGATLADEGNNVLQNNLDQTCEQLSISDVQCAACEQLLFRPVVLNCGHVYCETCFNIPVDERFRCEVCQVLHPSGFPKVCLELDYFLEEQFPEEYALRREAVQPKAVHQRDAPSACSKNSGIQGFKWSSVPKEDSFTWRDNGPKIHPYVGCDSCGMYPIVGDRYKCKDCKEEMGFDLCGDCYNTNSKLPGRFNQQHTPEHKFELVNWKSMQDVMMRQMIEQLGDSFAAPYLSGISLEQPGDPIAALVSLDDDDDDDEETAENAAAIVLDDDALETAENDGCL